VVIVGAIGKATSYPCSCTFHLTLMIVGGLPAWARQKRENE
jgi:hypothetical protein